MENRLTPKIDTELEKELLISPDDQDGLIKDVLARLAVVTQIEEEEAKSGSSHQSDKKIIFSTSGSRFIRKLTTDPTRLPNPKAIPLPPMTPLFEYVLRMARVGPLKTAGNETLQVKFLIELPNQATIFGGGTMNQEGNCTEKNFEIFNGLTPTAPVLRDSLARLLQIPNNQSQQKRTETPRSLKMATNIIKIEAEIISLLKSLFRRQNEIPK